MVATCLHEQVVYCFKQIIMSFNLNEFIQNQRVLDTHNVEGVKIFENFSIDFYHNEMYNRNEFYLYKTFPDGSEWSYQDAQGNRYMHPFNQYSCTITVTNSQGQVKYSKNIQPQPAVQPTWEGGGAFASFKLDISSRTTALGSTITEGRPILFLPELDVYTIHLDYGAIKKTSFKRISGAALTSLNLNDVIVIKGNELEILPNFYQGPKAYNIDGQQRILYNIHRDQRHIVVLN